MAGNICTGPDETENLVLAYVSDLDMDQPKDSVLDHGPDLGLRLEAE